MHITSRARTAKELSKNGNPVWWLVTEENGARSLEMRYLVLGKSCSTSLGDHPWEQVVYVSKGWGVLRVDGKDYEVMEGDAVHIKAGEKHQFLNPWENPMELLFVMPAKTESLLRRK